MNPVAWDQVKELFSEALKLPRDSRIPFVRDRSITEPDVMEEVIRLLEQDQEDDNFLETPTELSPAQILEGSKPETAVGVLGDFELLEEIGEGAMGRVYRARQISLDREVAIKVMQPHLTLSEQGVARFRREAAAAARLRHDNIVSIHSVGESDGIHYFAMDFIRGRGLDQILKEMRAALHPDAAAFAAFPGRGGESRPALVARMIAQIAEALQFSHDHGIIHRDVKPGNILIDERGRPYVADFGLAKDLELEGLVHSGRIAGTPYYMSPEQTAPDEFQPDARTDQFSLGVVMYELLTLNRPFDGLRPHDVLRAIREVQPRKLSAHNPKTPADLETICLKTLEKEPDRRYESAGALALDLERFLNHESIEARAPSARERIKRTLRSHVRLLSTLSLVAAALVAAFWLSLLYHQDQELLSKLEPLLALEDEPNLATHELSQLAGMLESIPDLREQYQLDDRQRATLERVEGRIHSLGNEALRQVLDRLSREYSSASLAVTQAERSALMSGSKTILRALLLGSDDVDGLLDESSWQPLLSVRALQADLEIPNAQVLIQRLNPRDGHPEGPEQELGRTPLVDARVPPGYYRITVIQPGLGWGEATRALSDPARPLELRLGLTEPEQVRQMLLIPDEGAFEVGEADRAYPTRDVRLPAFLIDRTEVSCARYKQFVEATGYPRPAYWQDGYDPAWDALPVVGVGPFDAEAFAAWEGKRLPTVEEWDRVARWLDRRRYPWGGQKRIARQLVEARANVQAVAEIHPEGDDAEFQGRVLRQLLQFVVPVDQPGGDVSPDGLFHLLGNVQEWTETLCVEFDREENPHVTPDQRICRGASWAQSGEHASLAGYQITPNYVRNLQLGFRCVKSVRD